MSAEHVVVQIENGAFTNEEVEKRVITAPITRDMIG